MKRLPVIIALLLLAGTSAWAVAPSREVMEKLKASGQLEAFIAQMEEAKTRGVDVPEPLKAKQLLFKPKADTVETLQVVVILVDFPDKLYTGGYTAASPSQIDSVLFSTEHHNPTGSLMEYYLENSYGKFCVLGDIYGWYTMPQAYSYYSPGTTHGLGPFPNNTQQLTIDAVNIADNNGVDFSKYAGLPPFDKVNGLFIVHAGTGFEESGIPSDIHSHKWNLGPHAVNKDGILINSYTVEPEESNLARKISPIGVFCHEFGHSLGLPDLYDTADTTNSSAGLGRWSLMASGNYNNHSQSPAHLDAYCKILAGFITPTIVTDNIMGAEIPQVETNPVIYHLWQNGSYPSSEYFLVENRQQTGFDISLPGSGLLIYHVDDLYGGSNHGLPYHVALEQADGQTQLEHGSEGNDGDPWPGSSGNRSFDDLSNPNSRTNDSEITQVAVWDISNSDQIMTANLDIRWSRPHFDLDTIIFVDSSNNGIMEQRELVRVYFYIRNDWLTANNATIILSTNDHSILSIDTSISGITLTGNSARTDNSTHPFIFRMPDTLIPTYDSFFISIESDYGLFGATFGIERTVGKPQILIVDADKGGNYEDVYGGDFYKRRIPTDIWTKIVEGTPSANKLKYYKTVIWYTGDSAGDYMQTADISTIKDFLDTGGNLFLTGQGIAGELQTQDSAFLQNYLHAQCDGAYFNFYQDGISGSPIGDSLKIRYFSGCNQMFCLSPEIIPINGGVPEFKLKNGRNYSAVSFNSSDYKVVFFNWGYEAILNSGSGYTNRDLILGRILNFFGDGTSGVNDEDGQPVLPISFSLGQNYPNPFNPSTAIKYSIRNTGGRIIPNTILKIYNILGQEIKTLVDRKETTGEHTVRWDGTDQSGKEVASGIYFYRLIRGLDRETKKMILLK
ncbi:MAG: M6 family metalloprotease domain-containing protein [candidate division Zixibacteria bacterium]|nr:M6 family metalloprotease domain-containing protein [candidate division Zixibacteria bacterium]